MLGSRGYNNIAVSSGIIEKQIAEKRAKKKEEEAIKEKKLAKAHSWI